MTVDLHPNHNRRRLLTILGILFGVPILVGALFALVSDQLPPISRCPDVANNVFFKVPSTATSLDEVHLESSANCIVWLRFQLPPSELSALVASTLIDPALSPTKPPQFVGGISNLEQETGWEVSAPTSFLAGEGTSAGKTIEGVYLAEQFIFVDTSKPNEYVVYLATSVY